MVKKIDVVGLGAGDIEQLSLGIYRRLIDTERKVVVRTANHPVVQSLINEGVELSSFDYLYQGATDFPTVYKNIVATLLKMAASERIIYAVPGHPMLAEKTVQLLLEQKDVQIEIIGGQSYLDALFTSLKIDPIDGFQFLDATSFNRDDVNLNHHLVFCQVYDTLVASDLKITLMEDLPHHYEIIVAEAIGTAQEKLLRIPLEELDRNVTLSNLTSVYIPPVPTEMRLHQFASLRSTIRTLRGPEGCSWDQRQTHETLRKYAIEEVYELIDAIDREDDEAIVEELGDVLLQVMLHSQIGEDNGYFSIDDVILSTNKKMIYRHPHVFSPGSEAKSWDELKREENPTNGDFILESVIMNGPSLHVAEKLQSKAAKVGFDWDNVKDVWDKLQEEVAEFHEAVEENDERHIEEEFGDILFVLANIARFYKINPELALRKANDKFKRRFTEMEKLLQKTGDEWSNLTLKQWDELWDEVKRKE